MGLAGAAKQSGTAGVHIDIQQSHTMTTETTTKPTAAQAAYMARQGKIEQLISDLRGQLKSHAARAAEQPNHYGFVGDLGRVEELLEEVVDGLRGRR